MRKLFGRDKPKVARVTPVSREEATGLVSTYSEDGHYAFQRTSPPPIDRGLDRRRSLSHENWEVLSPYDETSYRRDGASRNSSFVSLPPGASPPTSSPLPRSASPFSVASHPSAHLETNTSKKKPPSSSVAALGILKALEPQNDAVMRLRSRSEEHLTVPSEATMRAKKRTFWDKPTVKDKERDQERAKERERKDEEVQAELTRMIGYLTATASEDWSLVLEVCERASASERNAREAIRALRREFKYGEPSSQLSAARLWAIMLQNSSEIFAAESSSRKFLESIGEIIESQRTPPVVRERLMDVVAAAAFASNTKSKNMRGDREGFRSLWKKIKPVDKPDEGVPFDSHDSMFNPPASRPYTIDPTFLGGQVVPPSPNPTHNVDQGRKQKSAPRDGVISLKEDIKRLFQECKIGHGNATLLSEALAFAKPEDLSKDLIREFYATCRASQELIYAQIPWATAGAERSRLSRDRSRKSKSRSIIHGEDSLENDEPTTEEKLLAALLTANEALLEALRVHNDLENMAMEKQARDLSRTETRRVYPHGLVSAEDEPRSKGTALTAPPPAPHGPRLPLTSSPTRTPSPVTSVRRSLSSSPEDEGEKFQSDSDDESAQDEYRPVPVPAEPSAKALGKRRVIEVDEAPDGEDIAYGVNDFYDRQYSHDSSLDERWKRDVHYVYDAAAERTEQRMRDGLQMDEMMITDGRY